MRLYLYIRALGLAQQEGFEQGLRAKTIVTGGGLAVFIHPRTLCAHPLLRGFSVTLHCDFGA